MFFGVIWCLSIVARGYLLLWSPWSSTDVWKRTEIIIYLCFSSHWLLLRISVFLLFLEASYFLPPVVTSSHTHTHLPVSLLPLWNALNVLIFAHANTRVSQQQRLNSSADPRPTGCTTNWHLDSLQVKWLPTRTEECSVKTRRKAWPTCLSFGHIFGVWQLLHFPIYATSFPATLT